MSFHSPAFYYATLLFIKRGVKRVEVFLIIECVLRNSKCVTEALIVDYLALTKEFKRLKHVGVIYKS